MKRSWLVSAVALSACATTSPTPPLGVDVVDRCAEVLDLASNLFPTDRYAFAAEHCALPMIRETRCRDAVKASLELDSSSRARLVADACSRAYCPRMRAPKAELCTTDFEALSPSQMLPLGLELFARVRDIELGPAESKRWDEVIGAPRRPTVATAPQEPALEIVPPKIVAPPPKIVAPPPKKETPPPKVVAPPPTKETPPPKVVAPPPTKETPPPKVVAPPPTKETSPPKVVATPPQKEAPPKVVAPANVAGEVRVQLALQNRRLGIALGSDTWSLSEKPAASDFDAVAERVLQLGGRSAQVVIEVGRGIEYHHLVGVLNALGSRGVRNIAIASSDD